MTEPRITPDMPPRVAVRNACLRAGIEPGRVLLAKGPGELSIRIHDGTFDECDRLFSLLVDHMPESFSIHVEPVEQ